VAIAPSYAAGFTFSWELRQDFRAPLPWVFTVEQAETDLGPWTAISPELTNLMLWAEQARRVVGKEFELCFRLKLVADGETYYSHVVRPYGRLERREFLIARDIIRQELLQQKKMSGKLAALWLQAQYGPRCSNCLDPITNEVVDSSCKICLGTGRAIPYHGPYVAWVTLSPSTRQKARSEDGIGMRQNYDRSCRLVGFPYMKPGDIVAVVNTDKRYRVAGVAHLTEIRGVPVAQQLEIKELPTTDPVYYLGTSEEPLSCVYL
jgi:hypothetical protein